MNFSPTLRFGFLLLVLCLNIVLIFLVRNENRKSVTNRIFIALNAVVSFWLVTLYLDTELGTNLYLARISIFLAAPMSMLFFLLAHTLPSPVLLMKKRSFLMVLAATVLVMIVNLSPLAFTGLQMVSGVSKVIPGPGMLPFSALSTFFSLGAVYVLIKKLRKAVGTERRQLTFVVSGIFLMLSLIITTILIPVMLYEDNTFISLAPLYAAIFLVFTAVAILRYQLFNIKIIATEGLAATLIVVLLFEGITSGTLTTILFKTLVAILVGILGNLLVKSVRREIEQKEELSKLASSLETANEQLKELDRQKTDFLSIAAHQLRTPLSIINGYIELIKDGAYGKVGSKVKEILKNMDESNGHLIKLVNEFLDITRIEQGRTKFDFKRMDMCEIINSVVDELKDRAVQNGLKIVWDVKECKLHQAAVDEEKIRHVVFNFVDNAIKYSQKGKILVGVDEEKNGLAVRITDNGFGFDKVDEANFFQKFYRGNNVKGTNVTGTGLGLYVCRKFIEGHGGRIWAHSPGLGKGSEFGFWVPFDQAVASVQVEANGQKLVLVQSK